jgi:hypothetical protein
MEFDIDIGPEGHGKKHDHNTHDRFFFILSIFLAAMSVMAAYSSISASRLNVESNHNMSEAITHLVNSSDWWNDYQAHKLREKIWEIQIDNLNSTMNNPSITQADKENIKQLLVKYQSYQNKLYNKSAKESLVNTSEKATLEENEYQNSMKIANHNSSLAEQYEFATTFLVISTGLGVMSDLTKKRLLAYPCFAIGGVGIFFLISVVFGFVSIV